MKLDSSVKAVLITATIITAAFLGAGYWTQAKAADRWTGCHVGAQVGAAITKTELSAYGSSIDGLGGDGVTGGVNAGCDLQIERFLIGAFGQYNWSDADFKAASGSSTFTAGIDQSWAVGARAGVLITPGTLAYGLAGYTEAKASSNMISIPDLKGYMVGGGMETQITTNVSLKLEYQYAKSDSINIGYVALEPTNHTVMVGVSYLFGAVPTLPMK